MDIGSSEVLQLWSQNKTEVCAPQSPEFYLPLLLAFLAL